MSTKERFTLIVDVHIILIRDGKVLLLLRQNTGYEDGKYHLPAGHMDGGEPVTAAVIRETKEEIGVNVSRSDLKLAHVMHSIDSKERMGFFFEARQWQGEPQNMEPEKHGDIRWFALEALPDNMVAYARYAMDCYNRQQLLSEYGWQS